MIPRKYFSITLFLISIFFVQINAQKNFYEPLDLDTVKWSIDDFGKMWTFDNVPVNTFEKEYGFKPSEDWLNDVQKSALQFGWGCSGAFVSEDGLIMTNHHCGRNQLNNVEEEGEDLLKNGFYAEKLEDERKIENLFVDQLMFIEDVTKNIKSFMASGNNDDEKINLRDKIIDSLTAEYSEETGLECRIVTLYHGGKYSLYGYRRYEDIRLVMAPDFQIAATGWDWDNFTYPRYELDFMFYRAYDDNGDPVKSQNYFSWSDSGAVENEPIFVVGRPGSTDRLYSIAQLEYLRDYSYPQALIGFNEIYYAYYDHYSKYPENEDLLNRVMGWGNARKSYAGRLNGLKNEFIMKKKIDFQEDLKSKVMSSPNLNEKYGHVWDAINTTINEMKNYSIQNSVVRFKRILNPEYYKLAETTVKIARQKAMSNDEREEKYRDENLNKTIEDLYPMDADWELQEKILKGSINYLYAILESDDDLIKDIFGNKGVDEVIGYLKENSNLFSKEGYLETVSMDSEEILNSNDPLIKYVMYIEKLREETTEPIKELRNTLAILNELLGEVVFYVYGNKIPPDATSTIRISDGVIKGYEYNGTIAPGKTTYYGLWDRYESFDKKTYPWGLHDRWKNPPMELDLSIDVGFASTNDIVGGNSGSSVINVNKEVVGLVHDGNIESLAGHTIFLEENNRTVATDSQGLLESLKYVYKTDRLVRELLNGKME